jgi:hypothetical protein
MPELSSGERHNLRIYNASELQNNASVFLAKATAKTSSYSGEIMFMIALALILALVILFLRNLAQILLVGVLGGVVAIIGAGITLSGINFYIFVGVAILIGIIVAITAIPRLKDEVDFI